MVISGADFRPEVLRSGEVVSMLLDDEEMLERHRAMRSRTRKGPAPAGTPGEGSDGEQTTGVGGDGGGDVTGEGFAGFEAGSTKESLLDRKRKAAWARSRVRGLVLCTQLKNSAIPVPCAYFELPAVTLSRLLLSSFCLAGPRGRTAQEVSAFGVPGQPRVDRAFGKSSSDVAQPGQAGTRGTRRSCGLGLDLQEAQGVRSLR